MISVPVMSQGIRSGVNWMRLNFRCSAWASVATIKRLGQAGHADRQAVAAGEEADQHLLDHLLLADDHLVDLAAEHLAGPLHALHGFFGAGLDGGRLRWRRHAVDSGPWTRSPETASYPALPGIFTPAIHDP